MPEVHFDDREDAEAFVADLESHGLAHRLHRDEFAGEDDFEDAAWLVEVDAAVPDLRERAERAGGWLVEAPGASRSAPPPLPEAPRRIKGAGKP
ncbi:hypothetical protein [Aeromicrobium duanguangcaii]|uniref:DUF2007 domain-containing protein n=1 Tax=Aeromicrobium duanguangcaii TaxID=2968086 RepID=A0ABY5KJU0_9ACTN|nr:hypothetical protein [Aeromicrobium duanguangcaii]MCD9153652.1 hypothetical protein [Aeromicrobium duanguangcaii]MCL3836363.1 hypothetical protein [Aeromicrobium duanguangcaii]UUI69265.1 hypothetical protein NP095_03935 [Aeromicrobium duanguangcaii]